MGKRLSSIFLTIAMAIGLMLGLLVLGSLSSLGGVLVLRAIRAG